MYCPERLIAPSWVKFLVFLEFSHLQESFAFSMQFIAALFGQ